MTDRPRNPMILAEEAVEAARAALTAALRVRDSLAQLALQSAGGSCAHLGRVPYRRSFANPNHWRCPDCGSEGDDD